MSDEQPPVTAAVPDPAGPIALRLLPDTASVGPRGQLLLGGVDTVELADRFGTPLFVYDEEHLRRRCRQAVRAFPGGAYYATKAFLCGAMARVAHEEGMRLDVASGGELALALRAGIPATDLLLHGNNKSDEELTAALDAGVGRIVIDSFDEIERLERLLTERAGTPHTVTYDGADTHDSAIPSDSANRSDGVNRSDGADGHGAIRDRPNVLIRITPGLHVHTHQYISTGQEDSKFGFGLTSGAAEAAITRLRRADSPVRLVGLHLHIGSQVFVADNFARAIEAVASFVRQTGLPELNVGGGLGVAYVAAEHGESILEWGQRVHAACAAADIAAVISAEPGRAIVAQAAITLYRVGTVKDLPGIRTYVAVDGGMIDNPRPAMYGSEYEAFLPRALGAARPRRVRVVGKHCESGDVLLHEAAVPEDLAVGDVLATPVTGAYGWSMGSNYNRMGRPAIVFVADGQARLVVRREHDEDLMRTDLDLEPASVPPAPDPPGGTTTGRR